LRFDHAIALAKGSQDSVSAPMIFEGEDETSLQLNVGVVRRAAHAAQQPSAAAAACPRRTTCYACVLASWPSLSEKHQSREGDDHQASNDDERVQQQSLPTLTLIAVEVQTSLVVGDGPELSTTCAAGVTPLLPVPFAAANVAIDVDTQQYQWEC
jgi:hypothetical protein